MGLEYLWGVPNQTRDCLPCSAIDQGLTEIGIALYSQGGIYCNCMGITSKTIIAIIVYFFRLSQQNVKKLDNFLLNAENNTFPYKYPKEEKNKFSMLIIKKWGSDKSVNGRCKIYSLNH